MDPADAFLLRNLLHRDVQAGAGARRSIVDLAGIGPRVIEEFPEALPRRIVADDDAEGVAADADDVGKVVCRIQAHLTHEWQAKDGDRYLHQRVAVGRRVLGNLLRPQHASRTRPVFNDDLLLEIFFGSRSERPHPDIGGAARCPRHDQSHRPTGVILRGRRRRGEEENGNQYQHRTRLHDRCPSRNFQLVSRLTG